MFRQLSKRVAGVVFLGAMLSVEASQAAEACMYSHEQEADKIRFVETQLKVAALQCRSSDSADLSVLYSSFVKENRPYLMRSSKPLRSYLSRAGKLSLTGYVQGVAKRVSFESAKVSQFCNRAKLAAQYSAKSTHPVMLVAMLPVKYESPAARCVG